MKRHRKQRAKGGGAWIFKIAGFAALLVAFIFLQRISVALDTGIPAPPAAVPQAPADTEPLASVLSIYRNDTFGYSIGYTADWLCIEAVPRKDTSAEWSGAILLEKEVQKVTFQESTGGIWPGEFQIRVVENPERLTIDSWIRVFRVRDVSGEDLVTETSLAVVAGRPGCRAKIMLFDHMEIQLACIVDSGVLCLSFASSENINDPQAGEHARVYNRMAESLALPR